MHKVENSSEMTLAYLRKKWCQLGIYSVDNKLIVQLSKDTFETTLNYLILLMLLRMAMKTPNDVFKCWQLNDVGHVNKI